MAGIAAALRGHRQVGLDTSVFIYHIEGTSDFAPQAQEVFDAIELGVFAGLTSVLTLMELAVKPLQLGRFEVADEYEVILTNFPNLTIIDLDRAVIRRAAELRATYRLRSPAALQVAACIQMGATAFVTNDAGLRRVRETEMVLLSDFDGM